MGRVVYNLENMEKCDCCICKVQRYSDCPRDRTKKIQSMEAKDIDALSVLDMKEFPWLYCATGLTECTDLNFEEECLCKDCKVFKENHLSNYYPEDLYCRKGLPNI